MASANTMFKSHEDYRRNKELEEARKAGLAPAAIDEESGKTINPHIPQYMSSAPWYLHSEKPTLKHQKDWREGLKDDRKYYDRGAKIFQAKTYRKGACENCGAITHKTKDCVERPRKIGAKYTKAQIAADEKIEQINLETFDAKKDRWNGYDTTEYARVMDLYEKAERAKLEAKKKAVLEKLGKGEAVGSDDEDNHDDDKIDETEEAGFGKLEKRVRTTGGGASGSVRNLRIREDTAKYLYNLDPNSAHYDPKSRSMRADPQPHKPANEKAFMGDNFTRQTGDFYGLQALTVHSINALSAGAEFHPQAAPSQAEALHKQFRAKKEAMDKQSKTAIMDRYGNAAKVPDSDEARLLLGQTEGYVEYNSQGRVIKGEEAKARSRYEEDAYPNNHTSVWGSWWRDGEWGYACCHQTVKNSYCTGHVGEQAAEDSLANMERNMEAKAAMPPPSSGAAPQSKAAWGTDAPEDLKLDKEKLRGALKRQEELNAKEHDTDERKRKYNSISTGIEGITDEEMEAYRLRKARAEDPMAQAKAGDKAGDYDFV